MRVVYRDIFHTRQRFAWIGRPWIGNGIQDTLCNPRVSPIRTLNKNKTAGRNRNGRQIDRIIIKFPAEINNSEENF
jgi:hypothetical protein